MKIEGLNNNNIPCPWGKIIVQNTLKNKQGVCLHSYENSFINLHEDIFKAINNTRNHAVLIPLPTNDIDLITNLFNTINTNFFSFSNYRET